MFRYRMFSSTDRFMSNVPNQHWNKLDAAILTHMNKGGKPFLKVLISFSSLAFVWVVVTSPQTAYFFKTYILSFFQ